MKRHIYFTHNGTTLCGRPKPEYDPYNRRLRCRRWIPPVKITNLVDLSEQEKRDASWCQTCKRSAGLV